MSSLINADGPTLVALACATGAVLCALVGWLWGSIKALKQTATRRDQTIGATLVALGSVGFIVGMAGVRYTEQITSHINELIG